MSIQLQFAYLIESVQFEYLNNYLKIDIETHGVCYRMLMIAFFNFF
jgi:hypothetical protein